VDHTSMTTSGKAPVVFEIHQGLKHRGADLSWLSQWPHEREVVFAPMSGLEVQSTRVDGSVLVIVCSLCVNLRQETYEQVVQRRQRVVRDTCEHLMLRICRLVEHDPAWEHVRALHPDGAARRLVKAAVTQLLRNCTGHAPEYYSDDQNLCSAIESAIHITSDANRWADEMPSLVRYLPVADHGEGRGDVDTLLRMTSIDFARQNLGSHDAVGLCGALVLNTSLTNVNLLYNGFSVSEASTLADIARWREPPLSLCGIGYRTSEAKFVGNLKLGLSDAVLLSADLRTRPSLAKLVIDENPLGVEGGKVLCDTLAATTNAPLRHLSMANTGLGPDGATAVREMLLNRTSNLAELNIAFNRIGASGAKAIANALGSNSTLTALNLHYNALEDAGAESILRALQSNRKSKLGSLVLSSNAITHFGIAVLANALADSSIPHLAMVDLSWNKLGGEGGNVLCKALEAHDRRDISLSLRSCGLDFSVCSALKECALNRSGVLNLIGV